MTDTRTFLSRIASKLAVLAGGAVALSAANTPAQPIHLSTAPPGESSATTRTPGFKVPAKLILKQQKSGFGSIAQHDSHDSHDSHASHDSHSSHSSSAY
jgi:hypothetical protein